MKSTRLELVIVGTVFVVLLLCRQPPKSGNAGVVKDVGWTVSPAARGMEEAAAQTDGREMTSPVPAIGGLRPSGASSLLGRPAPDTGTTDNTPSDASVSLPPTMKRIGVVDATKCESLNYKDVMFGEITVEYVWDGRRSVPCKVCRVKEKNGTISTWVFNNRDDIVVSPIDQPAENP